jgi:catechol 2,3-dioxygenase-like lactoylglutathione lyase family enzyme
MLRGLSSVRYHTTDLERAKRWYVELLGIEPYWEQVKYAEFRPGHDYQQQLVLLDSRYARNVGPLDSTASAPVGSQRVGAEPPRKVSSSTGTLTMCPRPTTGCGP